MGYLIVIALLFTLGSAVGSFLNVLVSRSVANQDWVRGRSVCDHCGKILSPFDLIPIWSFVVYRGKSRCCQQPLSYQHPLVEALTGLLFVWWYVIGGIFFQLVSSPMRSVQAGYWLAIAILLLIVAIFDAVYGLVPLVPVYVAMALSVLYRTILYFFGPFTLTSMVEFLTWAIIAWGFFYALYVLTRGRGIGMGDVYLAPLYGLLLGYPRAIVGIVFSFWLGAIWGIGLILTKRKKLQSTLPFAPFMIAGMAISMVIGKPVLQWWGLA